MPRYIDADALENEVHTFCREFIVSCRDFRTKCALYDAMKGVLVRIYDAPTLSPDDVRGVGKWEDAQQHGLVRCSVCKDCYIERDYIAQAKWRYCPNCGARLEVSDDA